MGVDRFALTPAPRHAISAPRPQRKTAGTRRRPTISPAPDRHPEGRDPEGLGEVGRDRRIAALASRAGSRSALSRSGAQDFAFKLVPQNEAAAILRRFSGCWRLGVGVIRAGMAIFGINVVTRWGFGDVTQRRRIMDVRHTPHFLG